MELNRARQVLNNKIELNKNARNARALWRTEFDKYQRAALIVEHGGNPPVSKAMCIKYICDISAKGCLNTIEVFFPTYFSLNLNKLLFIIGVFNHFGDSIHWELRKIREIETFDRNWCRHDTKWHNIDVIDIGKKAVNTHFYVVHAEPRLNYITQKHLFWTNKHNHHTREEMRARDALDLLQNPQPDFMNQPVPVNNSQQQIDEVWSKIASAPNADDLPECYLCMETIIATVPQITLFNCNQKHPICLSCAAAINLNQLRACGICRCNRIDSLVRQHYTAAVQQNKSSYE